jgi:hypothetical protein
MEIIMPRKMSVEKEREFAELSRFLEHYVTKYWNIHPDNEIHPSNVLVENVKKHGKSLALQGLKQAVNEIIEETAEFDSDNVKNLDSELNSKSIITLSALRKKYWSKYKAILKRGNIKNETEYYLMIGLLCDVDSEISNSERELISKMVNDFERGA